jgi:hypothetical protein
LTPWLTRALRDLTSRYLFKQDDYGALRRRLGTQISARTNESDVLDYVTEELAHVLNADAVTWEPMLNSTTTANGGKHLDNAVAVPTEHGPNYQLRVHGLGRGRRNTRALPQDVIDLVGYAAKLAGRQIDVIRNGDNWTQPVSKRTSQLLFVTLGYEIGRIREQFTTLQQQFIHQLYLAIDIPGDLFSIKIPPYLIQPLVDNAVRHGIAPQNKDGRIMISAAVCDGEMTLSVSDTGDGFVPIPNSNGGGGSLRQLRSTLSEYYGCEATFRLDSLAGYGTTASINLPIRSSS